MPCADCTNPTLCTDRCQAYAAELAACEASGQMTAQEVSAHVEAGEMPAPKVCGWCMQPRESDGPAKGCTTGWRCAHLTREQSAAMCRSQLAGNAAPKGEAGEMPAKDEKK